jgi:hypothetical protein
MNAFCIVFFVRLVRYPLPLIDAFALMGQQ